MEITQEQLYKDIENAYRKYKHFVYRDTTFPLLREQLAAFETNSNLEEEFIVLCETLRGFNNTKKLRQWLNEIDYWLLPKSINPTLPISDTFLTNETIIENIEIKKDFALIKAPIQIHIISILWIMKGGCLLENAMKIKPSANRLELNEDKNRLLGGFALFQPYYKLYQNWRDEAFDKAIQLVEEEKDVLILSLDVKDYFPSMQVDFKQIITDVYETQDKTGEDTYNKEFFGFLTKLLKKIQEKYEIKIKTDEIRESYGLPIGLMSSAVIANWYLKEFDEKVSEIVNPTYYGRYVDDILMVIPNPKMPKKEELLDYYGEKKANFIKKEIFKWYFERYDNEIIKYDEESRNYQILLIGKENNLPKFQDEKIKFIFFNHKEPTALLHKFRKDLKIESSEFRLLPEEMNINDEFYSEAHFLAFEGSNNKLRNVTGFGVDLFGASKFLAKKIYSALQADREIDEVASKQILTFFKGARAIESVKLWEKVATYFVATKDKKNLIRFIKNIQEAIKCISNKISSFQENEKDYKHSSKIKENLRESLAIAVSTALALEGVLNINYGEKDKEGNEKSIKYSQNDEKVIHLLGKYDIDEKIIAFRKSNMVRHNFIKLPLINYTQLSNTDLFDTELFDTKKGMKISYLDIDLIPDNIDKSNYESFELDESKFKFSPRYIHFHEIALSLFRKQLLIKSERFRNIGTDISFENEKERNEKGYNYIEDAKKVFEKANEKISSKYEIKFDYKTHSTLSIKTEKKRTINTIEVNKITIAENEQKEKMRVGLVNLKLDDRHIKESYLKNPIFDKQRKEDINHLLNLIEKETWRHGKLDIIVLPEVSIPYKALSWLCHYALQHDVIMVFGLEHWIVNNIAFNFMVTLLPFKIKNEEENIDGYKAILPVFRIKNHYSHEEKSILERYRYKIPEPFPKEYHIFDWKGINFATFNCFELANIKHRAMFSDEIDLIVASENNQDTNYFSNIMESYLRDLHCYVIQANNSKYGDTRISKPVMNAAMDQVKIKGGINAAVLIDEIDIKALRDFQIQEYNSENKEFKPTPPGFDRGKAMKRRGKNLNE